MVEDILTLEKKKCEKMRRRGWKTQTSQKSGRGRRKERTSDPWAWIKRTSKENDQRNG